jgi:hypothetical protein
VQLFRSGILRRPIGRLADLMSAIPAGPSVKTEDWEPLGEGPGAAIVIEPAMPASRASCHETLFAIRHADMAALLYELAPAAIGMTRLIRRLRVGWMHRHGIGIVRGLEPTTDEEIAAITTKRPGRKRLMLVAERFTANIRRPEYLDDVWDFPDGPFSLFGQRGRVGVGFKTTDRFGQARLHWVKLRDFHRFSRGMVQHLCDAAARYALRPEQYAEYDLGSR